MMSFANQRPGDQADGLGASDMDDDPLRVYPAFDSVLFDGVQECVATELFSRIRCMRRPKVTTRDIEITDYFKTQTGNVDSGSDDSSDKDTESGPSIEQTEKDSNEQ